MRQGKSLEGRERRAATRRTKGNFHRKQPGNKKKDLCLPVFSPQACLWLSFLFWSGPAVCHEFTNALKGSGREVQDGWRHVLLSNNCSMSSKEKNKGGSNVDCYISVWKVLAV